jgi:single-stranded-DNA-specific exonuclease
MRWSDSPLVLPSECGGVELLSRFLEMRGIPAGVAQENFLRPKLSSLEAPEEIPGMDDAVEILFQVIQAKNRVLIFSDYDVDGIVSATVMKIFLAALGLENVRTFLPDRQQEGYGLTMAALDRALAQVFVPEVFIALDCGTNSASEVAKLKEAGMRVMIVDHHQLIDPQPQADAFVNPQRGTAGHHFCTAGLVFKLCHAYQRAKGGREQFDLRDVLDLVALATVADLVPLQDDNRIFVREGLRRLSKTVHPGLRRLMEVSGVGQRTPTSFTLGFQLGPRINAGGRVGDASSGLELLLSHHPTETSRLARELDLQNRKRQELEAIALGEAEEQIGSAPKGLGLVALSERWHPGVVGIVASRLVRKFHRPSFVIALNSQGEGKGSGRGLPGLSLMDALRACSPCLRGFGGHDAAAGIVIEAGRIAEFEDLFQGWLEKHVVPEIFEKTLPIDIQLFPSHLTPDMARTLAELAPFGKGNPEPVLRIDGVQLAGVPKVFAERHLKFRAKAGERKFEVVGFDFAKRIPDRETFNLAGTWEWDEYTDGPRWRMIDWQ